MCERKAKKDVLATVVSCAAWVSADASRLACQAGAGLLGLFVSTFFPPLAFYNSVVTSLFSSVDPLRCLSLTCPTVWEPIPGPLLTNHSFSAAGAQIISLRSDDLVVPKLPVCGCE